MKPLAYFLIYFLLLIQKLCALNEYNEHKFPQNCPKVPFVKNVDVKRLVGGWYQQFATVNGSQAGCNGDCVTLNVKLNAELMGSFDYCCNKGGEVHCGPQIGSAIVGQNDEGPLGVMKYNIFEFTVPCVIVDVAYNSHFITYKCFYINGQRIEIGEIWSRSAKMKNSLRRKLMNQLNAVFEHKNMLIPIKQHEQCPYESELYLQDFGVMDAGIQIFEMFDD